MREIQISTEVFARIWSLRQNGEETEDAILKRLLGIGDRNFVKSFEALDENSKGLHDHRYGVIFPEGFRIERVYLGKLYQAQISNGQWVLEGFAGRYSKLNELSRVIGTKTENVWINWHYVDENGVRHPVSELRKQNSITRKSRQSTINPETMESNLVKIDADQDVRWCDDVCSALMSLSGVAHLSEIYREVKRIRELNGRSVPDSYEAIIRRTLETYSSDSEAFQGQDWFEMAEGKGMGVWALRNRG